MNIFNRKILYGIIFLASIILLILAHRKLVFPIQIKNDLHQIAAHYSFQDPDFESICYANMKGDGSETLIANIDIPDLREKISTTFWHAKSFAGPFCRIYIFVKKDKQQNVTIELNTSKVWRNSKFYFEDIDLKYEHPAK